MLTVTSCTPTETTSHHHCKTSSELYASQPPHHRQSLYINSPSSPRKHHPITTIKSPRKPPPHHHRTTSPTPPTDTNLIKRKDAEEHQAHISENNKKNEWIDKMKGRRQSEKIRTPLKVMDIFGIVWNSATRNRTRNMDKPTKNNPEGLKRWHKD